MIAWKAKFLRFDNNVIKSVNDIKNISQAVESKDTFFTFGSILMPADERPITATQSSYNSTIESQDAIIASLGEDFFWLYVMYGGYYQDGIHARAIIPSMYLLWDELYPLWNESLGQNISGYYIPSLSRLIIMWHKGAQGPYIYSVNNGNCTLLYNPPLQFGTSFPGYTSGQDIEYWICSNYSSKESMTDITNWVRFRGYINTPVLRDATIGKPANDTYKQNLSNALLALFGDYAPPDRIEGGGDTPPPYEPQPPSGPGDNPPGTFDDTSDPIPIPPIPTLSSADTGFTRIYNPTLSQVQALARYLWTEESVLQTIWNHIKQIFENPMQAMIGFNLVPCRVPDGGTRSFALMYIDTGVQMTAAASQFVDVDCGTLALDRYYGSALDQAPYTKVSCYLPYIGNVTLDTDEVMGTTLGVTYRIDIVSGSCVAYITVDGNVLYQYSGHCAINIPMSAADFSSYVSAVMAIAKLGVDTAVGSGNVAAHLAKEAEQQTNRVTTTTITEKRTERNPDTGRQITSGTASKTIVKDEPRSINSTSASFGGMIAENITNTVSAIMGSKPHIQHSGAFTGNSGYLGVRRPYLIIERPNICLPSTYPQVNGYPSMISTELGACTGYTQVYQIQLTGLTATNPEQAEIMELLKSGVIF